MYIEKVLDLCVQLLKNGGKNKSVAFVILFSVYTYGLNVFLNIENITNVYTDTFDTFIH